MSSDTDGDLTGILLADRFQLGRILGVGGSSEVYLAEHAVLGVPYAVKVLRESLADDPVVVGRFRREAYAASRLDHPHIVHTIDFGRTEDDQLYLVMEYVEGPSLRAILDEAAPWPLPFGRALRILTQVARALGHAHAAGIIHRDLKPENILLARARDGGDHAKILDFGLAKVLEGREESPLTQLGQVFGSPRYMSPEQARGQPVDPKSDLYSFGALAYEVLCGRPPFVYESMPELLIAHMEERPPLPCTLLPFDSPPLPDSLEELLLACVEKAPADRPASMEDVAARLEALIAEMPVASKRALPEDVSLLAVPSLRDAEPVFTSGGPPAWQHPTDRGPTLRVTDLQVTDPTGDPAERAWCWSQAVKQARALSERLQSDGLASEELLTLARDAAEAEDAAVAADAEVALADSALNDLDAQFAQIERDIRFALVDLSMTLSSLLDAPGLGLGGDEENTHADASSYSTGAESSAGASPFSDTAARSAQAFAGAPSSPPSANGGLSPGTVADLKAQIAALDLNLGERHREKAARQDTLEAARGERQDALARVQRTQAEVESRFVRAVLLARPAPTPWPYRQAFEQLSEALRRLRLLR